MSIRIWVALFIKTLGLGAVAALFFGLILLNPFSTGNFLGFFVTTAIMGLLFSAISQMGFFAYLTLHRIGLGMFKSHSLWSKVQWVLIAFTFFDLVYLRYQAFAKDHESVFSYLVLPVILLVVSYIVAEIKKRETNHYAFVPTMFLMFVVTAIEWIPDLRTNDQWLWIMGGTLLACNTYQVLKLHRLLRANQ